ncbi:MAG TPA: SRPBCC family protein [Terriglobales bacterium]|nr:SRPBCC family protein [Terriglobales bacterium]
MSQQARRFSYEVIVKASPKLAWEIFSDWRRWHTFSNVYGRLEWTKGQPWTVGSRLSIEVLRPVQTTIDHVITHCDPAERVGWIDHAMGVTVEQWVSFEPRNESGTIVRATGEIVGSEPQLARTSLLEFFQDFTRQWYEAYREVCNQLAPI